MEHIPWCRTELKTTENSYILLCNILQRGKTYCIKSGKRCIDGGQEYREGDTWESRPACQKCKCKVSIDVPVFIRKKILFIFETPHWNKTAI
jgi:hypothetical protein